MDKYRNSSACLFPTNQRKVTFGNSGSIQVVHYLLFLQIKKKVFKSIWINAHQPFNDDFLAYQVMMGTCHFPLSLEALITCDAHQKKKMQKWILGPTWTVMSSN